MSDSDGRTHCDIFFKPRRETPERVAKGTMILERRRARLAAFADSIFGEPAWNLILILYVSGSCICTSQLHKLLGCPSSVAFRWLAVLEGQGLVTRRTHPNVPLAVALDLTDEAYRKMNEYLDCIDG